MGKNKGKKQFDRSAHQGYRKTHEPTAMELAFLKAQGRRGDEPVAEKKTASQSAIPSKAETPISAPPKVVKPQVNTAVPNTVETKPVTSATGTAPIKKVPAFKQGPIKPTPPSAGSSSTKKNVPVNLGLKRVPDNMLVMSSEPQQETTSSNAGRHRVEVKTAAERTQVHHGTFKDEIDIVMGFDFGTSSSKVIIRDSGRRTAYAVPFDLRASTGNSYLIPTQLYISDDGTFSLSTGDHSCGNIKSHLMIDPDHAIFSAIESVRSVTVTEIAAAYMAQVIRFARAWFLKHTESIYKKTHIHWHLNMGIPSRNYDDIKMLELFRIIAMAAWRISLLSLPISIMAVKESLQEARRYTVMVDGSKPMPLPEEVKTLWPHPDHINVHPEVIMEVVGYARSPLRTNGLHLIVDVGATTLDAATFIIHSSDGEDLFPILETAVERRGTIMLHLNRVHAVKVALEKSLQKIASINPILPLPALSHYGVDLQDQEIIAGDESFFVECCRMIGGTIKATKDHRDPYSTVWGTELPVFICGGGGRLTAYRQMIKDMGARCAQAWDLFEGFNIKKIPKPDELQAPDLPAKEYDRLAVAYGLSFTSDEIGEVIAQSEIDDIRKRGTRTNMEDRFVSKDMC